MFLSQFYRIEKRKNLLITRRRFIGMAFDLVNYFLRADYLRGTNPLARVDYQLLTDSTAFGKRTKPNRQPFIIAILIRVRRKRSLQATKTKKPIRIEHKTSASCSPATNNR